MLISELKRSLSAFLDEKIDPEVFYDPANCPYVSITIVYLKAGRRCEEGFGSFVSLSGIKFSSTFSDLECLGFSKELQAKYLESNDIENNSGGCNGVKTEQGYCSSVMINQNCHAIIAIVASPEDSKYMFTRIKNKVEIISEVY